MECERPPCLQEKTFDTFVGENSLIFVSSEVKLNQEVIRKMILVMPLSISLAGKKGIQVRRYFPRKNPCE